MSVSVACRIKNEIMNTVIHSTNYFITDGLEKVDPQNFESSALKVQAIGLLQAVGYLKGIF